MSHSSVFHVSEQDEGVTLLEFLFRELISHSKKEIKRQIENNACAVNGTIERIASRKLAPKDQIKWCENIELPKPHFESTKVLYEDDDLFVYNKPPVLTCDAEGILHLLKPVGRFFLVHRLDKFTSGVLILAKTREVEKALSDQFKTRDVKKCYLALIDGIPRIKKGSIANYLGKVGGYQGQTIYGTVLPKLGKFAKTEWLVKESYRQASLIFCYPETGRTHQIRVHLSELGHPILGDYQYGKEFSCKLKPPRMMLHAYTLEFKHPMKEKILKIKAPIPKDFQSMIPLLK